MLKALQKATKQQYRRRPSALACLIRPLRVKIWSNVEKFRQKPTCLGARRASLSARALSSTSSADQCNLANH
eukprot:c39532_g1_i1 orf=46-261(+)